MPRVVYDHQTFATQEFGGISRYFCELASRVHGFEGFEATIVAPLHLNAYLPEYQVPQTGLRLRARFRGRGRMCHAVSAALSPPITWAFSPSLIHRTYYTPRPVRSRVPVVLSVFDMIHELFPADFGPDDAVVRSKRACVSSADHLICISQSTANDLMRLFDIPRSKLSIIYLGYSDVFAKSTPGNETSPHARPYILYVGLRQSYKNFKLALNAYASSRLLRSNFDLVAFGGSKFTTEELGLIQGLSLRPNSVIQIGGSDQALARLYRHARAFIYPSMYEGFGIPPLEAMSSGCVVACSNASSIPEVVGDAAIMFDPREVDAAREALEKCCFCEETRIRLQASGAARVREFSWDRCASETVAAYRRMINA